MKLTATKSFTYRDAETGALYSFGKGEVFEVADYIEDQLLTENFAGEAEFEIAENGTYDVSDFVSVTVNVQESQ